jgi:hypothetical protein
VHEGKGNDAMHVLEKTTTISDHRLVIEDAILPAHAEQARVIVLWETTKSAARRTPPPELAGMGEETGDILTGPPTVDWEALS